MIRIAIAPILMFAITGCNNQGSTGSAPNTNGQVKTPMNQVPNDPKAKQVKVYLNPLVMLLAGAEKQKGRPLTQEEVLHIRDTAASLMMSPEQAEKFYKSLDSQVPVHRMNPDRAWEEWQEIRNQVK